MFLSQQQSAEAEQGYCRRFRGIADVLSVNNIQVAISKNQYSFHWTIVMENNAVNQCVRRETEQASFIRNIIQRYQCEGVMHTEIFGYACIIKPVYPSVVAG